MFMSNTKELTIAYSNILGELIHRRFRCCIIAVLRKRANEEIRGTMRWKRAKTDFLEDNQFPAPCTQYIGVCKKLP